MPALNSVSAVRSRFFAAALRRLAPLFALLALALVGLGVWTLSQNDKNLFALAGISMQRVSESADFRLRHVVADEYEHVEREALLAALNLPMGAPLLPMELGAAKSRLEDLPWVAQASLRRVFPDTLEVRLREEIPFALWQKDGHLFLLNRGGQAFLELGPARAYNDAKATLGDFASLPYLVGAGALDAGVSLSEALRPYPSLRQKLRAAIRVGERRWDLQLEDGIRVQLPEEGALPALARLQRLHEDHDIFRRDIASIDLRLPDRIGFRLNEGARMPEMGEAAAEAWEPAAGGAVTQTGDDNETRGDG